MLVGECRPVSPDVLLHRLFERAAGHRTDTGLIDCTDDVTGQFVTYAAVNELANAAARRLADVIRAELGTQQRSSVIVLDLGPSCRLVVCQLAVLKLGLAYAPAESSQAADRTRYIVQVSLVVFKTDGQKSTPTYI